MQKKDVNLCLVLDCRVSSLYFHIAPPVDMPIGATWSELDLSGVPDSFFYAGQSDLRNYFYYLGISLGLSAYFSFRL